jgi:hypothetical protein
LGAVVDWELLLDKCPGAVGGSAPSVGVRGYVDVEEANQFEAMQYLNDRGAKYLTIADSPVQRCTRLTFKGGVWMGHFQRKADKEQGKSE